MSFAVGVVLHVVTHYHHPDFVYPQATTAWALVTEHVDDPPGSYPISFGSGYSGAPGRTRTDTPEGPGSKPGEYT